MRRVTVSPPRDPWGELFPVEEAKRATQFLVDTWHAVTAKAPQNFDRRQKEPQLTEQFWWYLDQLAESEGKLLGLWSYEKPRLEYDPVTRQKKKRIRQDIEYFSNAGRLRLSLTYEFKKLKADGDSWRAYQGKDGMRRFVDGYYAKQQPVAAMVAMTLDDTNRCIDGLRRSLLIDGTRDSLKMLPDRAGRYLREPSQVFSAAAFDTEHKRPLDQAPPQGATTLAHLFLALPPEDS
jgi:hypothetical protein